MKTTPCKGCGRPIVWAKDAAGKAIPLDPRAPVYRVLELEAGIACRRLEPTEATAANPATAAMVSHFATCSAAAQFSGRGKKAT